MKSKEELIDYIHSERFILDKMLHREGRKVVYMDAVHRDPIKPIEWYNGHLMNCKHLIRHVGTPLEITIKLANALGISMIDRKASDAFGHTVYTEEFTELKDAIYGLPKVVNVKRVK